MHYGFVEVLCVRHDLLLGDYDGREGAMSTLCLVRGCDALASGIVSCCGC